MNPRQNFKKEQLFFGIITPSFNQVDFLPQTIKSVTTQINQLDFYFVADGGSTDGSKQVLQKNAQQLKYVSESDKGQTNAINKGIAQMNRWLKEKKLQPQQVIFAYLNSDDYYLPGAIEHVRQQFQNHPKISWLAGDCLIVDENGTEMQRYIRWYKKVFRILLFWPTMLVLNPLPQPTVFIRFSALQKIGNFNESLIYALDYEYWLRIWKKYGVPFVTNQTLAAFRIHNQSKGKMGFKQQFNEQLEVTQRFCQNPAWLFLQKMHNMVIVGSYKLLK